VPEVGGQAGLEFQLRQELAWLRERFPDLRQEGRAPPAVAQDQAVDAGPQARQGVGFAGDGEGLGGVSSETSTRVRANSASQRRKARVTKGRGDGVFGDVDGQRPLRFEAADAAAQLTVLGQRDESRSRFGEFRERIDGLRGESEAFGDGVARISSRALPRASVGMFGAPR
jgi:hypothetical protein